MKSRKKIVVAGIHNGFQSIGSSTTSLELARPGIDIGPISFCSLRTRPLFVFGSKLLWFPPHPNDKQDPRDGNDYKRRPRFHSWRDCASCCFSDSKSHRFSGLHPQRLFSSRDISCPFGWFCSHVCFRLPQDLCGLPEREAQDECRIRSFRACGKAHWSGRGQTFFEHLEKRIALGAHLQKTDTVSEKDVIVSISLNLQYLGTDGSTSIDQASIPPSRFLTFRKPRPLRNCVARALLAPVWQYMTSSSAVSSSFTRSGSSPSGRSFAPSILAISYS